MPLTHNIYTLGTALATRIVAPQNMSQEVHLHNMTKSSNQYIYLGGAAVTITNSIHIDPGESLALTLGPGDDLWAVSDPNGLEVGVLVVKQD